jgi:hypothetical protein
MPTATGVHVHGRALLRRLIGCAACCRADPPRRSSCFLSANRRLSEAAQCGRHLAATPVTQVTASLRRPAARNRPAPPSVVGARAAVLAAKLCTPPPASPRSNRREYPSNITEANSKRGAGNPRRPLNERLKSLLYRAHAPPAPLVTPAATLRATRPQRRPSPARSSSPPMSCPA